MQYGSAGARKGIHNIKAQNAALENGCGSQKLCGTVPLRIFIIWNRYAPRAMKRRMQPGNALVIKSRRKKNAFGKNQKYGSVGNT